MKGNNYDMITPSPNQYEIKDTYTKNNRYKLLTFK